MSTQEFNGLLVRHADSLTPFAISLTKDGDKAKDLCQDTLCKAMVYKEHYQTGTNIKAWLHTIMRNIFINEYRRSSRKKLVLDVVQHLQPQSIAITDTATRTEINTAIYNLPSIFKSACVLYFEGYKYHEIASALNEPLGTIKSRIHFARRLLQKQISR